MKRLIGYMAALCLLAITVGCGGVTSTGTLAYISNSNGTGFTVYTVNTDGTLTTSDISPQSTPTTGGDGPRVLQFSPNGKWAYYLDNLGNNVYAYTRAGNGELSTQIAIYPVIHGASSLVVSPNSLFLYVALPTTQQLQYFSIDPATGILTGSSPMNIGYAITQLAMAPSGGALFGLAPSQAAVVGFTLNTSSGVPTQAGSPASVGAHPSYMILSANGSYMYVLDSQFTTPYRTTSQNCAALTSASTLNSTCSPTFYGFNVQSNGTLLIMNGSPFQENASLIAPYYYPQGPIAGATSNDNRFLFVANQQSHNISVYKISTTSGEPIEVLGSLTTVNGIQVNSASPFDCGTGCQTPAFLTVANANNALYLIDATTGANKIFQLGINQNTGALRSLNPAYVSPESSTSNPTWITIR
jgi:6-phosphogluconolactonase (cycloisomerase 2 family)